MTARLLVVLLAAWVTTEGRAQERGTVPVRDGELYYHTYGEGPPVLLLNGGPGLSSVHFVPLARRLATLGDGYRVVLFDQRGTGRSPLVVTDSTTVTVARMVEDVEALRVHLGVETWTVMGHSWGGMYGMLYATRHPDRTRGLVLSASGASDLEGFDYVWANIQMRMGPEGRAAYRRASDPAYAAEHPERAEEERLEALAAAYVFDPAHIPVVAEALGREGANFPEVRGLVYADLRRIGYDLGEALAHYRRPVLILHGRQDLVGEAVPLRTHAALPNSTLVWLNECSHYPWLDRPDLYFEAIGDFLAGTSRDDGRE